MQVRLDNSVSAFVDGILPRGTQDKILCVDVRDSFFGFDVPQGYEEKVHFFRLLFYRPSNYTSVLMHDSNRPVSFVPNGLLFSLQSCHDSCWRSDGFVGVKDVHRKIEREFEDKGHKEIWSSMFLTGVKILSIPEEYISHFCSTIGDIRNNRDKNLFLNVNIDGFIFAAESRD
jgi:hypothetical protein